MIDRNPSAPKPSAAGRTVAPVGDVAALRFRDLDASALAAWDRLADRAAEPNPFFRPAFVAAAADADGSNPLLLVATSGPDWVFCLPVERASRHRRLVVPCLAPWEPDVSFLSAPLVDRDRVADAAAALARFVAAERESAALILDPVDPDTDVTRALTAAFASVGHGPIRQAEWERAALRKRPEPTYLEEAMSSKRRKEIRRLRRALGRELGSEVEVIDRSPDPMAYDAFLKLERESWKGEAGTALASGPEQIAFFRAMCQAAHDAGHLQLLSLEVGGRTAAMQCNLIDGGTLFGFKVAFDQDLARFSPGALLEVDGIGVFHDDVRATRADSCAAPDSELVNRIWADRRRMQTLVVPTGAPLARLVRPNLAAAELTRKVVRRFRQSRRGASAS
jgi:CelD/BcsL family acetyltransferase involved in cellulose biosynthesis